MTVFPADIAQQAKVIIERFSARNLMVATAESCTGGLIAGCLTDISGSSAVVDCGFVTYSNEAKMAMIGVQSSTLHSFGAVSQQVAIEMAKGAIANSRAQLSVAVTGVAGPGGGSADKPVGLVHIAAASSSGQIAHRKMLYGDIGRDEIRLATVRTALTMLQELALEL
jgi:nicotinamide-nucleotide amidase